MQVPILNGIYTNESSDFRTSYPRNLVPVIQDSGISKGYLKPAPGIINFSTTYGPDRGAINWKGVCYRVTGTKLIKVFKDGSNLIIGDVGGLHQVTFDYSFDHLAIASDDKLFLYDGTTLSQVTDSDLGIVLDVVWVDGYFMTTDGTYLVVTDINNPFSVNPIRYGSAEADPDPINALLKIRNEVYALNRYTVEVFDNIGGNGFPFERIEGAQMEKGTIGNHSCCVFMEQLAFVGGGFNEAISVHMGYNGVTNSIATKEINTILQNYTEEELSRVVCESKTDNLGEHLLIHLPDQVLVFNGTATKQIGRPVWYTLTSSLTGNSYYKAKNFVWCYDKWIVGNPVLNQVGYLDDTVSSHYGETIGWDFGTTILYNNTNGAIFHEIELTCLTGRVELNKEPYVWTQYSLDGETWSMEKAIKAGTTGERNKRIIWFQQGLMRNIRMQRFRGTSNSHLTIARLDIKVEPLNV